MTTEQTQIDRRDSAESEFDKILSHERPDVWLLLEGPSKHLTVEFQFDGREVLMEDTIVNSNPSQKVQGETTVLYLRALEIGLKSADRLRVNFRWIFNPTDPGKKMRAWFARMIDDLEPEKNKLRTEIPKSQLASEIVKIQKLLAENGKANTLQIQTISDPQTHETELRRKISDARNAQRADL